MSETEFLKIAEAKTALKGSFKGIIIKAGDLKSGTSNGKDWTMKTFTIEDESGSADLVAWGEEVSQFKLGYKYEITNPFWKTYVNKQNVSQITVQVGKYGTAQVIGSTNTESSSTKLPETPPVPKEQTLTPPTTATKEELEQLDEGTIKVIERESILLYKIRTNVEQTIKKLEDDPHGGMIGQFTELIYKKYFGDKK